MNHIQFIRKAAYFIIYYHTGCGTESYECYLHVIKPVPCFPCWSLLVHSLVINWYDEALWTAL